MGAPLRSTDQRGMKMRSAAAVVILGLALLGGCEKPQPAAEIRPVRTVTAAGAAHICLRKVDPGTAFELINRESVSILCAAPTVLISLANAPEELRRRARSGVRVLTAGAPPAAATIQRTEGELGWEVTHIYGLTETSALVSTNPPGRVRHGTVGLPIPGTEVRIAGDGEVLVRSELLMKGYWKAPELTAATVEGGWLKTGDIGRLDEDGYLSIVDRKKDLMGFSSEAVRAVGAQAHLVLQPPLQVAAAVAAQATKLLHVSNLFRIPEGERLADRLCKVSFADTVFFANSGAEAMECAIKMVRKYHYATGNPGRYRIIGCEGSFHGRTLATLAAAVPAAKA